MQGLNLQQNRIIKHNREQGYTKVIIRTGDHQKFLVEMQFGINVLSFLEGSYSFRCFQSVEGSTEKAHLSK